MPVLAEPKVLPDMPAVSVLEGAAQIDALPNDVVQVRILRPPLMYDRGVHVLSCLCSQAHVGRSQLLNKLVVGNGRAFSQYPRPVQVRDDFLEVVSPFLCNTGARLKLRTGSG